MHSPNLKVVKYNNYKTLYEVLLNCPYDIRIENLKHSPKFVQIMALVPI